MGEPQEDFWLVTVKYGGGKVLENGYVNAATREEAIEKADAKWKLSSPFGLDVPVISVATKPGY